MKSKLSVLSIFAVACLTACSSTKTPPPATTSGNPPVQQPAVTATSPSTAAPATKPGLDGKWEGNSGQDMPISFSVEGTKVTGINAGLKGQKDGCSVFASFGADGDVPLNGKTFTAHGKHEDFEFNLTGNLTSDTEASGTIDWKTSTNVCGVYNVSLKWTAKKMPPEPADGGDDE